MKSIRLMTPTKKTTAAIHDDNNIPRVAVIPMKMPSQIKAPTPANGMRYAHHT